MDSTALTHDPALNELALGVAALGIVADRAARTGIKPALSAEQSQRVSMKVIGTMVAALWQESVRDWVESRGDLDVVVGEHYEGGWPELQQGNVHVKIERHHQPNRSARRSAFEHQVGLQLELFPRSAVPSTVKAVNVCMTAVMSNEDEIIGLRVFAPNGSEAPLFEFMVDEEAAGARADQWMEANEPWVEVVKAVQGLRLATDVPQSTLHTAGRQFDTTVEIETPAATLPDVANHQQAETSESGTGTEQD